MKFRKSSFLKKSELERLGYDYVNIDGKYISNIQYTPSGDYEPNMPDILVSYLNYFHKKGYTLEEFIG
jgi:hypothetical protein